MLSVILACKSNIELHKCVTPSYPINSGSYVFVLCRPVFKDASGTLEKNARFSALYRQDSSKLSDEDMFKLLTDFRKYVVFRGFVVAVIILFPPLQCALVNF